MMKEALVINAGILMNEPGGGYRVPRASGVPNQVCSLPSSQFIPSGPLQHHNEVFLCFSLCRCLPGCCRLCSDLYYQLYVLPIHPNSPILRRLTVSFLFSQNVVVCEPTLITWTGGQGEFCYPPFQCSVSHAIRSPLFPGSFPFII
jgi:hypothetical protein